MRKRALSVLCFALYAFPAFADDIKITTWNLDWYFDTALNPSVPNDVAPKTPQEIKEFVRDGALLDSDLIAVQEVENAQLIGKIFPNYRTLTTDDDITQKVGLALRKDIKFVRNHDYTALADAGRSTHPLRSGLDVTVYLSGKPVRILAVHLKTGCWDRPLGDRNKNCPVLEKQFSALKEWTDARRIAHESYIILGDFNRRMTLRDPLYRALGTTDTILTDAGYASPCGKGEYFIDHILLSRDLASQFDAADLSVNTYPADIAPPSDHCPVSILLKEP